MKIAISSGHVSTIVLAYADEDEEPLTEKRQRLLVQCGPDLNLHCLVPKPGRQMAKRLKMMLKKLKSSLSPQLQKRGFRRSDRLALSLPGVSTVSDNDVGEYCVLNSGWPIADPPNYCIVDDTYAGLIAGSLSTLGICAFADVGASVYIGTPGGEDRRFTPDKTFKFDGYGAMLGDHGSGFRLAMTTLERVCRYLDVPKNLNENLSNPERNIWPDDAGVIEDLLGKLLPKKYPMETRLQNWFDDLMANRTPQWRFVISDLAKTIIDAAATGDRFAMERVEEAAEGMVTTIRTALNLEDYENMHSAPIFCHGSMFQNSRLYLDRVSVLLRRDGKNNKLELAKYCTCVGALLIASSPNWTVPDADAKRAIESAISSAPVSRRKLLFNRPPT